MKVNNTILLTDPFVTPLVEKAQALIREFERQHGSTACRVLVDGGNFNTPAGQKKFQEQDLLHQRCVGCVQTVCETLAVLFEK